jgi:hypothetical protein
MKTFYGILMLIGVVMITFVACQVPTPAESEAVSTEMVSANAIDINTPAILVEEQNAANSAEEMIDSHRERLERLERLLEKTSQSNASIARLSKVKR